MQDRRIGAYNIIQDSQISLANMFDFLYHYKIITQLLTFCAGWGGGGLVSMGIKIITWLIYLGFLWVPLCLIWRFATFFIAAIIRLFSNRGGKKSLVTNITYVAVYSALIPLVYIPFIFPLFGYVTYTTLLESLKII